MSPQPKLSGRGTGGSPGTAGAVRSPQIPEAPTALAAPTGLQVSRFLPAIVLEALEEAESPESPEAAKVRLRPSAAGRPRASGQRAPSMGRK